MAQRRIQAMYLPLLFLALLVLGYGLLALSELIADPDWKQAYSMTISVIIVLPLSIVAHLWAFSLISGRAVGDVWRPALLLNVAIILPASIFFAAAFSMVIFHMTVFGINVTWPLALPSMITVASGLIFLEFRVMRSRIFSLVFDERFRKAQITVLAISGVFCCLLSALEFGSLAVRINL